MIFKHTPWILFAGFINGYGDSRWGKVYLKMFGKSYVRIVENMLAAFYPRCISA